MAPKTLSVFDETGSLLYLAKDHHIIKNGDIGKIFIWNR
jgi:hypothetical protein